MKVRDQGKVYEQPETGSIPAVCYKIIDIGTQQGSYEGKTTFKHQVVIGWELEEKMKDGKPFTTAAFYTASLSEKAKLRAHLEAWRGQEFTKEELEGFDLKNILGKPCMLTLIKKENGNVSVQSIAKIPKGLTPPAKTNQNVYFSMDDFNRTVFDALSDGYKNLITKSPEYGNLKAGVAPGEQSTGNGSDEEVPF